MNAIALRMNRGSTIVATFMLLGLIGLGARLASAQDIDSDPAVSSDQDVSAPDDVNTDGETPEEFPLPINVQGSWSGSITDDSMGGGTISISIAQHNTKLSGGWTATFPTSPEFLGNFKGSAGSRIIKLKLASAQFNRRLCRLVFKSVTASGVEIQGNYIWYGCGRQFKGDKGGSIDITPNIP
jgi:hypothetical protein